MRISIDKKDIIWNYAGTILAMFSNIIMLPFLLMYLSTDEYGLWNIFVSVGGIATLFDFGFNITFARNITYCWSGVHKLESENVDNTGEIEFDIALFKNVISVCQIVYYFISITALLVIGGIGTIYIRQISRDILSHKIMVSWFVYVGAVFINLLFGYYDSFLRGVGDIAGVNKVKVFSRTVYICLTVLLLMNGTGLVGVSVGYLIYGLLFRLSAKKRFFGICCQKGIDILDRKTSIKTSEELFKTIWHNAWREGVVQVSDYCITQLTVIVVSFYCSLSETGAYSLALQLTQAIVMIATVVYNAFQPELQSSYVGRYFERIRNIMSFIIASLLGITTVGGCMLFSIGLPIIRYIKPSIEINSLVLFFVLIYQLMIRLRNCYTSYYAATNRIIYAKSFLMASVVSIVLSVTIMQTNNIGIYGIICAQVISQLLFNMWHWPIMVHKEIELNPLDIPRRAYCEMMRLIRA